MLILKLQCESYPYNKQGSLATLVQVITEQSENYRMSGDIRVMQRLLAQEAGVLLVHITPRLQETRYG